MIRFHIGIFIVLLSFSSVDAKTKYFIDTTDFLDIPTQSEEFNNIPTPKKEYIEKRTLSKTSSLSDCNQIFNDVVIGGSVVMNCITTVNKISKVERQKINNLSERMSEISTSLLSINQSNVVNKNRVQKEIRSNKIRVAELNQEYLVHKEKILSITKVINRLKNLSRHNAVEFRRGFTRLENKQSNTVRIFKRSLNRLEMKHNETALKFKYSLNQLEDKHSETLYELNKLGISILQNTNSIIIIESRVDIIENDLNFLMDEYTDGNLKTISFYGPKMGITTVNNSTYNVIGVEYERLLDPKYNMSLFVDISKYDGNKKDSYSTLNGISDQIINSKNSFYTVNLGARKFLKKVNNYNFYVGGSLGYATGDEKTFLSSAFSGVEMYRKFNKLSLELGYSYFNKIKHKRVLFNPLGESESFDELKGESGLTLNLKYSTR